MTAKKALWSISGAPFYIVLASAITLLGAPLLTAKSAGATPSAIRDADEWVSAIYHRLPVKKYDWSHERFTPELRGLIDLYKRHAEANGGFGALDAIPFCGCQDEAHDYRLMSTWTRYVGRNRFRTVVVLRNDGLQRFTIDMVKVAGGGFAVSDVHSREIPSLYAWLWRYVPRREV